MKIPEHRLRWRQGQFDTQAHYVRTFFQDLDSVEGTDKELLDRAKHEVLAAIAAAKDADSISWAWLRKQRIINAMKRITRGYAMARAGIANGEELPNES